MMYCVDVVSYIFIIYLQNIIAIRMCVYVCTEEDGHDISTTRKHFLNLHI